MSDRFERGGAQAASLSITPLPTSPAPLSAPSFETERRGRRDGRSRVASFAALGIGALLVAAALALSARGNAPLSLSLTFGAVFGLVLQRSRFCFYCAIREWLEEREPGGVLGLLTAAAVGTVGYAVVFGAWMPDPTSGRLPPDAFIGPLSWVLVLGGLAFGAGMAISGSCISAHLYRLAEGSPTAPFAILGTLAGFGLGFANWNTLYLAEVAEAPTVWLPALTGYAGFLALTLLALLAIAWAPILRSMAGAPAPSGDAADVAIADPSALAPLSRVFSGHWPGWVGGAVVGALGTVAYLRVAPLGVTAELSARARDAGQALQLLPDDILGLDGLRGCVSIVSDGIASPNGIFVLGLVLASFASALASRQFRPRRPAANEAVRGLLGGVALGWGAMVALGCSIGTLLSGISAGAVSGWVFGGAMLAGLIATRALDRRWLSR